MELSEIESLVISVLEEIQAISGRPPIAISRATCPLTDLENFDSLNAVEATIALEGKLGTTFATNNILLDDDGKTPLNIAGITKRLMSLLNPRLAV